MVKLSKKNVKYNTMICDLDFVLENLDVLIWQTKNAFARNSQSASYYSIAKNL